MSGTPNPDGYKSPFHSIMMASCATIGAQNDPTTDQSINNYIDNVREEYKKALESLPSSNNNDVRPSPKAVNGKA